MLKNFNNKAQVIEIINPSQLIMEIDSFFQLSKRIPSQSPILFEKEKKIFSSLGVRKGKSFDNYMFSEINLGKIEEDINHRFQDGFDLEDDLDTIDYPFFRTSRVKSELDEPTVVKELLKNRITAIKIGNHRLLENNGATIQRFNSSLLALSSSFEVPGRRR